MFGRQWDFFQPTGIRTPADLETAVERIERWTRMQCPYIMKWDVTPQCAESWPTDALDIGDTLYPQDRVAVATGCVYIQLLF